ncbi:electron transfer flavoprotein subunit beta/FixA family protein [Hippea sp. KM1]|uniref:electron transfer flavoprotein subunit beta/FixA family protein n=1 Tax=Hippea sp. KM1 TaxID=944481 RepID=UPI00046D7640|nr:electron transfer flavoprotein subunit beta/FixA family protein [Hippea sp. KM1]
MHSLVFIKQVPDAAQVRVDYETGTLIREGVPAIINPFDKHAIEAAVRIKNEFGGKVSVICMGPPMAEDALKEAMAMGADNAYLLSDRVFAGSDTLATSYALWAGAQKIIQEEGPVDLFWAGKQAIDGDTAQTGPGIATRFDIPLITYVVDIKKVDPEKKTIQVVRLVESGQEVIEAPMPCFLTVEEELNTLSYAPLPYLIRAAKTPVKVLNSSNTQIDASQCGLKNSPTKVKKAFTPPKREGGEILEGDSVDAILNTLYEKITPVLKQMGKVQ